jgi:hypothetical protein
LAERDGFEPLVPLTVSATKKSAKLASF